MVGQGFAGGWHPAAIMKAGAPLVLSGPRTTDAVASSPGGSGHRWRWRDLQGRERLVAWLLALALLMAPAVAFAQFEPDWAPTSDNAFIALRAFDVGTPR